MAEFGKPSVYQATIVDSDERLNIKFHNENVAIDQYVVVLTETGVTLSLTTPKGAVDVEMTREFARQLAGALNERLKG